MRERDQRCGIRLSSDSVASRAPGVAIQSGWDAGMAEMVGATGIEPVTPTDVNVVLSR